MHTEREDQVCTFPAASAHPSFTPLTAARSLRCCGVPRFARLRCGSGLFSFFCGYTMVPLECRHHMRQPIIPAKNIRSGKPALTTPHPATPVDPIFVSRFPRALLDRHYRGSTTAVLCHALPRRDIKALQVARSTVSEPSRLDKYVHP